MKLVLSRKGFDSAAGGGPSPILPDGRLVSLPVPEPARNKCPRLGYEQLVWAPEGRSYLDVMRELGLPVLDPATGAHLDPDLTASVVPRQVGWRPGFGQSDAAQALLANQGVGVGDIFLFFGYFRQTRIRDGKLTWDRRSPGVHALFGYLEVAEVVHLDSAGDAQELVARYPWASEHPHVRGWWRRQNTLYLAAERSSIVAGRAGGGPLRWSPLSQLTVPGASRSIWRLPPCLAPTASRCLSYHQDRSRWTAEADGSQIVRSVARGQEFVIKADEPTRDWVQSVVRAGVDVGV